MIALAPPSPHKRTHGQFFTAGNPFFFAPFQQWFKSIPLKSRSSFLEPFAGANHIVRLMREAGYRQPWMCFDIDPPQTTAQGIRVEQRNTLVSFPQTPGVVITNPPYLAKNSAARRGLSYPGTTHDDLYKHSLEVMLAHAPYVAAIIPESFVVSGQFHDRLAATVSLTSKMFHDTDCPVCLALFVPASHKQDPTDFELWDENTHLGNYQRFARVLAPLPKNQTVAWKFNDPQGKLGLFGVDNTREASIRFVRGSTIPGADIKHSSRAISRISGVPADIDLDALIDQANQAIAGYRRDSHDTLLTSFKGLRSDGKYRRRLDFTAARSLLDHCVMRLRARNATSPAEPSMASQQGPATSSSIRSSTLPVV